MKLMIFSDCLDPVVVVGVCHHSSVCPKGKIYVFKMVHSKQVFVSELSSEFLLFMYGEEIYQEQHFWESLMA